MTPQTKAALHDGAGDPVPDRIRADHAWMVAVRSRSAVAGGVISLELVPDSAMALPPWEPGAHIDVVLRTAQVRQYALCGSPAESDIWRIAVAEEFDGNHGSDWIQEHARPGSELRIRGPRNGFPLYPASHYLFVAYGIGIAPLLPMISHAEAFGADWSLLYGGQSRSSMPFLSELVGYRERVVVWPEDKYGPLGSPGSSAIRTPRCRSTAAGPESYSPPSGTTTPHGPPGLSTCGSRARGPSALVKSRHQLRVRAKSPSRASNRCRRHGTVATRRRRGTPRSGDPQARPHEYPQRCVAVRMGVTERGTGPVFPARMSASWHAWQTSAAAHCETPSWSGTPTAPGRVRHYLLPASPPRSGGPGAGYGGHGSPSAFGLGAPSRRVVIVAPRTGTCRLRRNLHDPLAPTTAAGKRSLG